MLSEKAAELVTPSSHPVVDPVVDARLHGEPPAMNGNTLRQTVTIANAQGFHLRPITAFAQLAGRFESQVLLARDGRSANGKSAWDLMSMLAPPGTEMTVEVNGPDAEAALEALVNLLANLADGDEEAAEPPASPSD